MAGGKYHIAFGFVAFVLLAMVAVLLEGYEAFINLPRILWLSVMLFMALLGSAMPDYDHFASLFIRHRSIVTHSVLIPSSLTALFALASYANGFALALDLYLVVSSFLFGFASHLLLDYWPSLKAREFDSLLKKRRYWKAFTMWKDVVEAGITPDDIRKKFVGSYRVHIPGKEEPLSDISTHTWLVSNGIIVAGFGGGLVVFYALSKGLMALGLAIGLLITAVIGPVILSVVAVVFVSERRKRKRKENG